MALSWVFSNIGFAAEAVDIDLGNYTIISRSQKAFLAEVEEEKGDVDGISPASSYLSDDDLPARLRDVTIDRGESPKKLHVLSFSKTAMDDEAFGEVTEKLVSKISFEDAGSVLDLSFNSLTPLSASHFWRWIDEAHVQFIKIYGNPKCSMRYVIDLCKAFKKLASGDESAKKEEVRRLMGHIAFLPEYYIYQAKTRVKIYRQLQETGYLPENWDKIQKATYIALVQNKKDKQLSFSEESFERDPDADLSFEE